MFAHVPQNVDNADLTAKTGSLPIDKAVKAFKHTPEYSCEEVRLGQARFQVTSFIPSSLSKNSEDTDSQ